MSTGITGTALTDRARIARTNKRPFRPNKKNRKGRVLADAALSSRGESLLAGDIPISNLSHQFPDFLFLSRVAASPANPEPKSNIVAGSGTG